MKASELRGKTTAELNELLDQLQDTRFRLRLQHHTGQLKRVSSLGEARRDIARVRTVLSERQQLEQARAQLAALSPSDAQNKQYKALKRKVASLSRRVVQQQDDT